MGHVEKNRRWWEAAAGSYQRQHGERLRRRAAAWGVWRIPESQVGILGEVEGLDVLELGCGAAQWSVALDRLGARPVGLDVAAAQLDAARRVLDREGRSFPLVQASAEVLPFADGSFDLVLSDHGAMSFADPRRTVPEVARVLRPGGALVFCTDTPWHFVCWDRSTQRVGTELREGYFGMRTGEDEETVQFQLPYGAWIELFREHGLEVERLAELRPPAGARTTYEDWVPLEWARRWPAEQVWRAVRRSEEKVPDLVGVAEAAALLGWDKRRVATYVARGSFPPPVAELAGGRVWRRSDVRAFGERFRARRESRRRPANPRGILP